MWKNCVNLIEINFDVHAILFNPYRWIFETVTECDLKKNPKSLFVTSQLGLRNEKLYVQIDCRMCYIMKLLSNGICQFFGKCHSEKNIRQFLGQAGKTNWAMIAFSCICIHVTYLCHNHFGPFWQPPCTQCFFKTISNGEIAFTKYLFRMNLQFSKGIVNQPNSTIKQNTISLNEIR